MKKVSLILFIAIITMNLTALAMEKNLCNKIIAQSVNSSESMPALTKKVNFIDTAESYLEKEFFSLLDKDNEGNLTIMLTHKPYLCNAYNSENKTILHQAVALEKRRCITALLDCKANPNCLDADKNSPLHIAVKNVAPFAIVAALLAAEADPDLKNQDGLTPFAIACTKNGPNIKAFKPYGYLFFSSLWPYKNPFLLLKNDLEYLKKLDQEPLDSYEWQHAAKALTIFFDHIKNHPIPSKRTNLLLTANNDFIVCHTSLADCALQFKDVFLKDTIENAAALLQYKQIVKELLITNSYDNNYEKLDDVLKYCTPSSALQYEMLKLCIESRHNNCLLVCLKHNFSPNGYHRQISLLHYAVTCRNHKAIKLLASFNADLTAELLPLRYNINLFGTLQTPLDYAINCKKTSTMDVTNCIKAMVKAIENRIDLLMRQGGYCGLIKHAIPANYKTIGFCGECINKLREQLDWHEESISAILTNNK